MKYIIFVTLVVALVAFGLGIKNTLNSNLTNNIVVIDSDRIIASAMAKIKEDQYVDVAKINQVGQEYRNKIRATLEQYAKDNNVVILDKRAVLTNNVKDLTDEFIKTFINY
ncbi:Type-F conjugative transfer system protein (TrbI_Ftype) [Campylobacter hyointestinalis subsp. hyointestinalis]|uniref:Type-F conjugative transfer system protein (TrbI_Ftype) n=1 Tax=Campylobacter hyointestinalis subsp. hyointestinalis TaxID=91352 RepID=A0A0S4SWT0_CAMHY|nr:TrbI F-type domain-containing protein [Campylobacter hyointestinalis]CUU90037.1 Type-F conjugative transfer system protein (TrbI_Ftype) [Campylobacter hyointestinalis subsp. hyointestinalis]